MPVAVDGPGAVSSVGTTVLIQNNLLFNTGMVMELLLSSLPITINIALIWSHLYSQVALWRFSDAKKFALPSLLRYGGHRSLARTHLRECVSNVWFLGSSEP